MTFDSDFYTPYVSVAERKKKAARALLKLQKTDKDASPVIVNSRNKLAISFWGQAWCRNLNAYSDMDYRLDRGRSYLRAEAVIDLKIGERQVNSKVLGSEIYDVVIEFKALKKSSWDRFVSECTGEISSLSELFSGVVSDNVAQIMTDKEIGLFPKPSEISFDCNCLDYAGCCKHVAATLYGIGIRFDADPGLFFLLRGQDPTDLIKKASDEFRREGEKNQNQEDLADLFGIELSDSQLNFDRVDI